MNRQPNGTNRTSNQPENTTVKPGAPNVIQAPPKTWGYSPSPNAAPASRSDVAPPTSSPTVVPTVSDEAIARRAYEKFLARGAEHGQHQEDWDAARQELVAEAAAQGTLHKVGPLPSERLEEQARQKNVEQEVGGGAGGD